MKLRAILTDLDGTLLEPDGTLHPEAAAVVRALTDRSIPLLPVTSKTAAEVAWWLEELGLAGPGGFENGAGLVDLVRGPRLAPHAVPLESLRSVAEDLRRATGVPVRTLEELADAELSALTALTGEALARARARLATLPLAVDEAWDDALRGVAPAHVRLVRGNRFLHLQGHHCKADLVPALLAAAAGEGVVVACGDAPNDRELLRAGQLAIVVPSRQGPHPALLAALPDARVAPAPHGRGWAAAVAHLLDEP